jgi:hypothetical protein
VHCFANQGIPTYVRILKDIETTPAVQTMTGEDDAFDTRYFCEKVMARHNRAVTLNGFCQGGFIAMLDILSGELDGLVDALITCVAPLDFIDAEVTVFPKGHGAIATSWSLPTDCVVHDGMGFQNLLCSKIPTTACALDRCGRNQCRGPVRFQLDLEHGF